MKILKDHYLGFVIIHLVKAKENAVKLGLDHHFISEIDHLIATAEANRECDLPSSNSQKGE